jgi:hypothetical protein
MYNGSDTACSAGWATRCDFLARVRWPDGSGGIPGAELRRNRYVTLRTAALPTAPPTETAVPQVTSTPTALPTVVIPTAVPTATPVRVYLPKAATGR